MSNKLVGIYKITNLINEKCYIGKSININYRWECHKKQNNSLIYKAFNKYGIENFKFEILKECPKEHLCDLERFYIRTYASWNSKYGYNMTYGGEGNFGGKTTKGIPKTEEHKRKISQSKKGKKIKFSSGKTYSGGTTGKTWKWKKPKKEKLIKIKTTINYQKEKNSMWGKKWWTNGIEEKALFECPENWWRGRLKSSLSSQFLKS